MWKTMKISIFHENVPLTSFGPEQTRQNWPNLQTAAMRKAVMSYGKFL
jgi:hypothetical protein